MTILMGAVTWTKMAALSRRGVSMGREGLPSMPRTDAHYVSNRGLAPSILFMVP